MQIFRSSDLAGDDEMKVKLGDISVLINGDRGKNYPSQGDIVPDGDIPFVNAGHISGQNISFDKMNYISKEKYDQLNSGKFQKGDILYCLRGSLGKKAVIKDAMNGAIASSLVIIRTNPEIVDVDYLMFALDSPSIQEQLIKANNGSSQPNLSAASVREYAVDLPDRRMQEEIVEKLSKARNIIKKRQQELQKLDTLIKSRFVEMFGDAVANPMHWPVKKLKDLSVQINSGNTPKGGSENYVEDGITFFRSQNVWKDRLEMDDIVYIDADTHASMKRSSLKHGDILMTKTGRINTENSSLGRAALYMGEDDMANVNGHVYFIRLKPKVNNKFVLRILVSPEYRDLIRSVCVGGIDKRQLNKEHIEEFPIICPPTNMVDSFIAFVEQIDKLKSHFLKLPVFPGLSVVKYTY